MVVLSVIEAFLLYTLFFGKMGLVSLYKIKKMERDVEVANSTLRKENERLLNEIVSLRKADPIVVERLARGEFGLSKRNELVFYFKD